MLNVKVLFLELHIRNTLSGEKRLLTKLRKDLHDIVWCRNPGTRKTKCKFKFLSFFVQKSNCQNGVKSAIFEGR